MARIVVLGGAESGVGAAVLAKVKGFDVFLSDFGQIKDEYVQTLRKWDIPFEQGGHTEGLILNADEVIKSPGIPSTAPMVKKLADQGTHIVSEIEFASRYDSAKKICITGSNGKTTTTSLVKSILEASGISCGNPSIVSCYNNSNIKASGVSYSYPYAYGITNNGSVSQCYNTGTVSGTKASYAIGGNDITCYYLAIWSDKNCLRNRYYTIKHSSFTVPILYI